MTRNKIFLILTSFTFKIMGLLFICAIIPSAIQAQTKGFDYTRGVEFYEQGLYKKAIEPFERAIKTNPYDMDAYLYLSTSYLAEKQYENAIQTVQKGLTHSHNYIRLMMVEAEVYYQMDDDKAIEVYKKVEQIIEKEPSQEIDGITLEQVKTALGQLHYKSGNEDFEKGRINSSIKNYRNAISYSPDSLNIQNNLAYVLLQAGRWDEAIKELDKAIKKFPAENQFLFMKGQAYRGAEKWQEMSDTFYTLYQRDTSNLSNAVIYGQSLLIINQAQKANDFLLGLLEDNPKEKELYELIIQINESRYNYKGKRNVLELQRKAFPEDTKVVEELAQTNILTGDFEKAQQIYDSLATVTSNAKYKWLSAQTWLFIPDYENAAIAYRNLTPEFLDRADYLAEAALIERQNEENKLAKELYHKSYNLEDNPEVALALMELYVQEGDEKQTLEFANHLIGTNYQGVGLLLDLKYSKNQVNEEVTVDKTKQSLINMFSYYESIQNALVAEAEEIKNKPETISETLQPKLLQDVNKLDNIARYIEDWYLYIKSEFTYNDASNILDDIILKYPDSAILYYFKGRLAFQNGELNISEYNAKKSIELGAKEPEVQFLLAEIYAKQEKIKEAILSYERTITLDEKYEKAYERLVTISQKKGMLDELNDRWLSRYNNNQENEILQKYLIEALHKDGRFDEATEIIERGKKGT